MADWIFALLEKAGYLALAFLMWLENIFPPIPSELVMPLAGYQVASGEMTFLGVILAGGAGSLAGAFMFYGVGRKLGEERLQEFVDRHGRWVAINRHDIDRASDWFDRHGAATVFFCRLIPGIRSVISIPAGVARQNLWIFSLFTFLGTVLWCAILAACGYALRSNFEQVEEYLNPVSWVVFAGIGAWYLWRVIRNGKAGKKSD